MARVLNWRRRYAEAPSCTAPAISCMVVVPFAVARAARRRAAAKPSATRAMANATTTYVTFALVRDNPPLSAAKVPVPDIYVLLYKTFAPAGGLARPASPHAGEQRRARS